MTPTKPQPAPNHDQARAEFYLCLARAFATPVNDTAFVAARDYLAADLAELSEDCGYAGEPALAQYREAIAAVPDSKTYSAIYARLFLVPGEHHPHLNAGVYLDGAIGGGTVTALKQCYRRCGLEKHGGFHDLPDHLTALLEFVAWLFAMRAKSAASSEPPAIQPEAFLAHFVMHWIETLRADIEAAGIRFALRANPHLALAALLAVAVDTDVVSAAGQPIEPDISDIRRLRAAYAGRDPDATDLAIIREKLAASGHATGHLGVPQAQRDSVAGLEPLKPPGPPRRGGG